MCHECISSSRPAILGMANRLAGSDEVPKDIDMKVVIKNQEEDKYPEMEEDPEMYSKGWHSVLHHPHKPRLARRCGDQHQASHVYITLKVVVVPRSQIPDPDPQHCFFILNCVPGPIRILEVAQFTDLAG